MKIIILAAGKGERLLPLTRNTPKPLLDMGNGFTLLEEQINRTQESKVVDEVVLVTGYLADQIDAKVRGLRELGVRIRTIYNPFYNISNNLVSLWLARQEMVDDFIITNGDNIFSPDIFSGLVNSNQNGIFLSVCQKEQFDDDDMKVKLEDKGVIKVGKTIPITEAHAESPGLVLVSGPKFCQLFSNHLDLMMRTEKNRHSFWLEIFNDLHEKGFHISSYWFRPEWKWQEVDFHLDINKARDLLRIKHD